VPLGNSEPLIAYPIVNGGYSAEDWNVVAMQNNRISVRIYPD
jgi:hypothetical protein